MLSQGTRVVRLPEAAGFSVAPTRVETTATSLAGTVIRQVRTLHDSTAAPQWQGNVPPAVVADLEAMQTAGATVYLAWAGKTWAATMKVQRGDAMGPNRVAVTLDFGIIRRVI